MSKDNQSDQSRVIGEMFDAANISQPVPFQGLNGGVKSSNIKIPAPRPQTPTANNGFTTDNLQQPEPQPTQESQL